MFWLGFALPMACAALTFWWAANWVLALDLERQPWSWLAAAVTASSVLLLVRRRSPGWGSSVAWLLRHDGEQWHWQPEGGVDDTGHGKVRISLNISGWMLLEATDAHHTRRHAWMLVRPARLGASGLSLRRRLSWA